MRKSAAIPLLLVLLSVASGALPVMCASECAAPAHGHAAPGMTAHRHHPHHAAPASSAGATSAPHCFQATQPALGEKALPRVQLAPAAPVVVVAAAPRGTESVATAPFSASPPGPQVRNAPLRI